MIKVFIDFEFNRIQERHLNLVCAAFIVMDGPKLLETDTYWLHNDPEQKQFLANTLEFYREQEAVFFAVNAIAEARCFLALNLDILKYQWMDLQLMYKMLTNHCETYRYGKQLIDGKRITTYPPPAYSNQERDPKSKIRHDRPQTSLLAMTYKLLGKVRDGEHKDEMRDLIISDPEEFTSDEKDSIINYCYDDVEDMPKIWDKIRQALFKLYGKNVSHETIKKWLLAQGEFAARTALMEREGYPVNETKVKAFGDNVPSIITDLVEDILSQELPVTPFSWDKRNGRYKMEQKVLKEYLATQYPKEKWLQTQRGSYSLALEAWSKHFSYSHDYPKNNLGAQMLRYLKTLQSLNGFRPKGPNAKDKRTFFDSLGRDGRVRPYFNIYGSQSGRSQPRSTGFIPLKAAWMRALIEPEEGYSICGIDWGSQEFLLSAIISGDKKMYEAYASGDVYLAFAKQAGAVPEDGTKEEYKRERNLFKSTVLGISYNMGAEGLAKKLTADTGEEVTTEKAQELINTFQEVYPDFAQWNADNLAHYYERNPIIMPCGWTMWCDNPNWRSINNVPIQGAGASIMRKAVAYAQDMGLTVIYTLHDALYIEFIKGNYHAVDKLYTAMKTAFIDTFEDATQQKWASVIRQDIDVWGPGLSEGNFQTPKGRTFKQQEIYIDERSRGDYERFKKYFHRSPV